ncbi:MAG: MBOAT family protein [Acidobacteria bacterium]|nr:MBOAT family protein [Acidobacteriota bacterium]
MIFHSLDFVVFFLVMVALYWGLPHRWQNVLLLGGSYLFYGWVHPWFLWLIFATTFIDYWSARGMDVWPRRRKAFLWLSIVTNFGLLGFFKYFNFFVDNVAGLLALAGWQIPRPMLDVLLPVGISFYTFQSMSYTIDVYRGHAKARTSFLDMATFVAFFPHLVAGPIMRATNLLPQVEGERRFSPSAARDATLLVAWGFFKKLVIADNVGTIANKVFALKAPEFYVLWAGVFAFCIQIYADFSAYTDIARGVAKWFGFDLIKNFEHPYLATGPTDFWRRWNISLSTWFRDYVFLPVAYTLSDRIESDRVFFLDATTWAYVGGMLVTMLTAGLWHGASWNFVIWGTYHGVLLGLARIAGAVGRRRRRRRRWLTPFQVAGMFLLTNLGWLFFRETELAALVRDLTLSPFQTTVLGRQTGVYLFLLAALYSVPLWIQSVWAELGGVDLVGAMLHDEAAPDFRRVAVQACLSGLLFAGLLVLHSTASLDFIYFRF